MVRILAEVLCTTLRQEFRISNDLFLLFAHDRSAKIYGPLSFTLSFCARPFDQTLGSSLIYFFYVHTTIQPKYIVLFHLFLFLCMTIRPRLDSSLIYFLYFHTTIRQKYMFLFHLIVLLRTTI